MINSKVELIKLQKLIPLDISGLKEEFDKHYLEITGVDPENQRPFESITKLSNARKYLNFTRMFIRNLIDPGHNEYIAQAKNEYEHMNGNIGRSDKRIDIFEKELQQVKNSTDRSQTNSFYVIDYKRLLEEQMNYFVIYVIKEAYREFDENEFFNKKGEKILKDEKFFIYLMFRQLYLSSETLGSLTREERIASLKKGIIIPDKAPSPVPQDATTEKDTEDTDENIEEQDMEDILEGGDLDELESI